MGKRIFISYSHEDKEFAKEVQEKLLQLGHVPLRDENDINKYDPLGKQIVRRIKRTGFFLLIWSRNASRSEWVKREIHIAQSHEKKIVIICLDDSTPSTLLPDQLYPRAPKDTSSLSDFLKGLVGNSYKRKLVLFVVLGLLFTISSIYWMMKELDNSPLPKGT